MKTCTYCGAEYPEEMTECPIDHTPFDVVATEPAAPKTHSPFEFVPPTESQLKQDWVTLVRCRNLVSADLVASRLRGSDIATFIPDEFLMQTIAFNVNTYGYVRVQVTPKDYEAAKAILSEGGYDG